MFNLKGSFARLWIKRPKLFVNSFRLVIQAFCSAKTATLFCLHFKLGFLLVLTCFTKELNLVQVNSSKSWKLSVQSAIFCCHFSLPLCCQQGVGFCSFSRLWNLTSPMLQRQKCTENCHILLLSHQVKENAFIWKKYTHKQRDLKKVFFQISILFRFCQLVLSFWTDHFCFLALYGT